MMGTQATRPFPQRAFAKKQIICCRACRISGGRLIHPLLQPGGTVGRKAQMDENIATCACSIALAPDAQPGQPPHAGGVAPGHSIHPPFQRAAPWRGMAPFHTASSMQTLCSAPSPPCPCHRCQRIFYGRGGRYRLRAVDVDAPPDVRAHQLLPSHRQDRRATVYFSLAQALTDAGPC